MNNNKWEELINMVENKFGILEHGTEKTEDGMGDIAFIVFNGPQGRVKLELMTRPVIIDKKTTYSKRAGTAASSVEYIYSDTEKTQKLHAFLWSAEGWREIPPPL